MKNERELDFIPDNLYFKKTEQLTIFCLYTLKGACHEILRG